MSWKVKFAWPDDEYIIRRTLQGRCENLEHKTSRISGQSIAGLNPKGLNQLQYFIDFSRKKRHS